MGTVANPQNDEVANRSGVSSKTANQVIERDQGSCQICGETVYQLHHVTYRSQGGQHTPQNLVSLCPDHHQDIHEGPYVVLEFNPGEDQFRVVNQNTGELVEPLWFYDRPDRGADEAHQIYTSIRDLRQSQTLHKVEIGENLCRLEDGNMWSSLNVDGLGEFLGQPEIGISRDSAYRYMRVCRKIRWQAGLDDRDIGEIGIYKCDLISRFVGQENFDDWVEKARALSRSDLKKELEEDQDNRDESQMIQESECPGDPEYITRLQHLLNSLRENPHDNNLWGAVRDLAQEQIQEGPH